MGTLQAPPIPEELGVLSPELASGGDTTCLCIPCGVGSGSCLINPDPKAPTFGIAHYEMFATLKTTGLESRLAIRDLTELVAEAVGLAPQIVGSPRAQPRTA